jgi:hypothetical protein
MRMCVREGVVEEARLAFAHNAAVYVEQVLVCFYVQPSMLKNLHSQPLTPFTLKHTHTRRHTQTHTHTHTHTHTQPGLNLGAARGAINIATGALFSS